MYVLYVVLCTSLEHPYFIPEDGDSMFLRNVNINLQKHMAPKLKITSTL
jgi:hypothetical protein